ncbi:MAG: lipocalin family protein [Bacteroidota bacterium]
MRATFVLGILLLVSCGTSDLNQQLAGKWIMVSVTIEGQDRSLDLNPENNRWLSFDLDGQFTSGSGTEQENAGTYQLDFVTATLELDSDAGEGDDSNWHIEIEEDVMIMRGIGTPRQESSVVRLIRAD